MEFSQYVIDAVSSVNHFDQHHHYQAAAELKDAASNAKDKQDTHALEILGGALSMSYTIAEQEFSPFVVWNDGSRSFALEDIDQSDVEILESGAEITKVPWIRAQLSHIVWHLSNNHQYGQKAVDCYLKIFDEVFDPLHWVECHNAIQCACHIAIRFGKASEVYKQTRAAINQKLCLMDGTDPLFLSLCLLQLVIKDATNDELKKYLQIVTKLADKNISTTNPNTHLADETYSVQNLILRRLNKEDESTKSRNRYAHYYETQAEIYSKKGDYFRAVIMLKKSCALYGKSSREKVLELRLRLEELQEKSLKNMQAIPLEFDVKSTYNTVARLFEGLSLQEMIVQMGRVTPIYKVEEVKQQIFDKQKKFVFSSMFSSSKLNERGQTVQELPPLDEITDNTNPDLLHKHMVHHVAEQRGFTGSIILRFAFGFFQSIGVFSEDDLGFLVYDNVIIPDGRAEIIKEGLYLGLSGKLYAAMHILLPQAENIFRNLVKMCGDTVTFLKEDGTEEYKPLSQLFKSEQLCECYSEDIIFAFQSIMDEPIGENLRNLNAHGVLEPQKGNSEVALCFLCLLIKLLSMYSINTRPILKALAERDSKESSN